METYFSRFINKYPLTKDESIEYYLERFWTWMVEEKGVINEASAIWMAHAERDSVGPDRRYTSTKDARAIVVEILRKAGTRIRFTDVLAIGSEDISVMFNNPKAAVKAARMLDKALPRASSDYRSEFGVVHNALASGPYDGTDLNSLEDYDELYNG